MFSDIEKRLNLMEDIEKIKKLIARYAKAADHTQGFAVVRGMNRKS